jgi:hypothetical protein
MAHPERIQAIVVQNAVAHEDGLGTLWETHKATAPVKPRNDVPIADVVSMYMWKRNSPHRTPSPHVVVSGDGWRATPRRGS